MKLVFVVILLIISPQLLSERNPFTDGEENVDSARETNENLAEEVERPIHWVCKKKFCKLFTYKKDMRKVELDLNFGKNTANNFTSGDTSVFSSVSLGNLKVRMGIKTCIEELNVSKELHHLIKTFFINLMKNNREGILNPSPKDNLVFEFLKKQLLLMNGCKED